MIGQLDEVVVYVDDMQNAVGFYRDKLGLQVLFPHLDHLDDYDGQHWVVLDSGACKLCLHAGGTHKQGADCARFVFAVRNVQDARASLIERGVQMTEVRSPAPGVFVCDGVDPAGNPFSIEQQEHGHWFLRGRTR